MTNPITPIDPVTLINDFAGLAGVIPFLLLPLEFWRLHRAKQLGKRTWLEVLANLSPLIPVIVTAGMVSAFLGRRRVCDYQIVSECLDHFGRNRPS
jgi:hypothetical protein